MNYKAFNLFLITLFSSLLALTIIANAHINRPTHINKHANKFSFKYENTKYSKSTHINKHANKFSVKHANTKHSKPTQACQSRGSPGWNDLVHIPLGYDYQAYTISNAQDCCNSCITNQTCFQWYFQASNTQCVFVTVNPCSGDIYSPSCVGLEGGNVRCSDGSGCN
ncbi:hypothetical protein F8M41_022752 [Gigaspora margarita]|uniref:Apple domain-containing protein n=1 Tax=Gigaspora margarita TaxID=4874 RepID=A0A8H4AEK1_GIGMA|nr:hypothetical protein F8M41_022752 [Gigaspora margarita]